MARLDPITLRGLDPRLLRQIRELARRERISLSRAAVRLLEQAVGLRPGGPTPDDRIGTSLDHLIGTWTAEQADEVLASIEACEQIDESLWR